MIFILVRLPVVCPGKMDIPGGEEDDADTGVSGASVSCWTGST